MLRKVGRGWGYITLIYYVKVLFRKFDCTESIALHDQDLFHQHSDLVSDCRAVKHCEAI